MSQLGPAKVNEVFFFRALLHNQTYTKTGFGCSGVVFVVKIKQIFSIQSKFVKIVSHQNRLEKMTKKLIFS